MSHRGYAVTRNAKEHVGIFLTTSLLREGGALSPSSHSFSNTSLYFSCPNNWWTFAPPSRKEHCGNLGHKPMFVCFTTTLEMFLLERIRNLCQWSRFSEVYARSGRDIPSYLAWDIQGPPAIATPAWLISDVYNISQYDLRLWHSLVLNYNRYIEECRGSGNFHGQQVNSIRSR